jgi:glycosyltransferase involved in cell wall biosynthesis
MEMLQIQKQGVKLDMHKNKIKVLHVVYKMGYGGIETFLMSMLRNYDREKFQMDILHTSTEEGEYAEEARSLGANLIHCPLQYEQARFIYKLRKILKTGDYSVVNNHLSDVGAGVILAAKLARVPSRVSSYHTNYVQRSWYKNMYMKLMRRIAVSLATDITTSSPDVSVSHFKGMNIPVERIHPISYGVDVEYFEKTKAIQPLPGFDSSSGKLIVGHIGHFTPQKNHEALLKIASCVIRELPNVIFLLRVSGGHLREQIEQKILQAGLSEHIVQVKGLSDIRQFYASIDVFVLPSRHEGMPVSVIEAQAAGKSVIASNLEGIRIAMADKLKCNLFAVDDVEPFSMCLLDLLKNKEKRITQGKIGQDFVKQNLDVKIAIQKYQNLYLSKTI